MSIESTTAPLKFTHAASLRLLTVNSSWAGAQTLPDTAPALPSNPSFARVAEFVRKHSGEAPAKRLKALYNGPREPGEHRLRVKAVACALQFVVQFAWPLREIYATPTGSAQLAWPLASGEKLVARFASDGRVAFAVVGPEGVQLTGHDTISKFAQVVTSYRQDLVTSEDLTAHQQNPPEDYGEDLNHTEFAYRCEILSTTELGPQWQSFGSSLSA